jgi:hypothetical protein
MCEKISKNFILFESTLSEESETQPSSILLSYLYVNNIIGNYKFDKHHILYGKLNKEIFNIPMNTYVKIIGTLYNKIDVYYLCNQTNRVIYKDIYVNMEDIE